MPEKVSTNKVYSGMHWMKRNDLKNLYHLFMLQFKRKLKLEESSFPICIEYTFEWKTKPLDSTNQTFMIKLIEDGLVNAGILPDDDHRYVRETRSITLQNKDLLADEVTIRLFTTQKS